MVTAIRRSQRAIPLIIALLAIAGWGVAQEGDRAARVTAHDASRAPDRCAACHAPGDPRRTAPAARGGCDAQCIQCHAKDTAGHHPTGVAIPALRDSSLERSSKGRIACRTCHDLDRPAADSMPWRAQSLFDAVFRRQARYPTYHLAMRNHRGQLCQSCH